jgi:hypothetical protein
MCGDSSVEAVEITFPERLELTPPMPEMSETVHETRLRIQPAVPVDSGCQWNPDTRTAALPGSDHHRFSPAIFAVDAGDDGIWEICTYCSQRIPFKGLPRTRLPRSRP